MLQEKVEKHPLSVTLKLTVPIINRMHKTGLRVNYNCTYLRHHKTQRQVAKE
jgi:hypothetical protein